MRAPEPVVDPAGNVGGHGDAGGDCADRGIRAALAQCAGRESYCRSWLALVCSSMPGIAVALVVLEKADVGFVPVAVWPESVRDASALLTIAERALRERRSVIIASSVASTIVDGGAQIAYPLERGGALAGVVALQLKASAGASAGETLRLLEWGVGWLDALLVREQGAEEAVRLARACAALDAVVVANEEQRLATSALAVANDLAVRLRCRAVMIGAARRQTGPRLVAMSGAAWFDRRSALVGKIEDAMGEAFEQQATLVHPEPQASRHICVAQAALARELGDPHVLSVPYVGHGHPVGVITYARDEPFDPGTVTLCEALGALLGPVFEGKQRLERWIAGRLRDDLAEAWHRVLAPRRIAAKVGATLALALLGFVFFYETPYRVTANAVIEGSVLHAAAAPFDGYVASADARAGDVVRAGALLAALEERDVRLELARWRGEHEQALRRYREGLAKHDRVAARIAAAQVDQAGAQVALAEEKLRRTRIVAPFDGVVVSGDLSQLLGSPVERGKVLFEVAPLDAYRVILKVDERDIDRVQVGQRGMLALTGRAADRLDFHIVNVTPISSPGEGANRFRVEARLDEASARLRPGMEGVGKITTASQSLAWIGTHRVHDWLVLALWRWAP